MAELSYQELNHKLEEILRSLQDDEMDIDQSIAAYEEGQKILKQLQDRLKVAENKIKKLPSN